MWCSCQTVIFPPWNQYSINCPNTEVLVWGESLQRWSVRSVHNSSSFIPAILFLHGTSSHVNDRQRKAFPSREKNRTINRKKVREFLLKMEIWWRVCASDKNLKRTWAMNQRPWAREHISWRHKDCWGSGCTCRSKYTWVKKSKHVIFLFPKLLNKKICTKWACFWSCLHET